ncbi:aldo/keto reductase [Nocardiopsis halophila]|uniref:aldo/keto reductase n=1 Tax=Nocardiopsis halophila TaxID=141692 RepID=UPI000348D2EC|nr:aldo/keto reductase [Nocardiopsis halophila]
MRHHLFGRTGLRVSELFLGGTPFFARGDGEVRARHRRILDAYAEAGGNTIDTASAYGDSEEVLGELLRGDRDRWVLGTKFGLTRDPVDANAGGAHRRNLALSLDRSLRRLRTDRVDLLWVHLWDPLTPLEETMRALDDAVRAGKVLYAGISDSPAWVVAWAGALAEWRDRPPIAGIQVPYNAAARGIERELLPMAGHLGLSAAVWRTTARGVLAGAGACAGSERESAAARAVEEVAAETGATAAQVAIAWTRARRRWVHPIVAASTAEALQENLGAAGLELDAEAVARLDAAAPVDPDYLEAFTAGAATDPGVLGRVEVAARGR